jgi:hypothetical protein
LSKHAKSGVATAGHQGICRTSVDKGNSSVCIRSESADRSATNIENFDVSSSVADQQASDKPVDFNSVVISDIFAAESTVFSPGNASSTAEKFGSSPPLAPVEEHACSNSYEEKPSCSDSACVSDDLIPLELYIQGNSHSTFLLFTEQGSIRGFEVIRELWQIILMQLCEIECQLLQHSVDDLDNAGIQFPNDGSIPSDLRYLMYDCATTKLTGNAINPLTSDEHDFCQVALDLREQFVASSVMVSKTVSSQRSTDSGVRQGDKLLFYRLPSHSVMRHQPGSLSSTVINQLFSSFS